MKRFGQVCSLSEEGKAEYLRAHVSIPQEIAKLISDCNLRNYSIFLKDNLLFTYFEYVGEDFEADMKKMSGDPDNQKWWDFVKPLMRPLETRNDGEFWADMRQIFFQE